MVLLVSNKNKSSAENDISKIMEKVFGVEIWCFDTDDIKRTETDKPEGSWKITNLFNGLKYPKTCEYGTYSFGKVFPVDWRVKKS